MKGIDAFINHSNTVIVVIVVIAVVAVVAEISTYFIFRGIKP